MTIFANFIFYFSDKLIENHNLPPSSFLKKLVSSFIVQSPFFYIFFHILLIKLSLVPALTVMFLKVYAHIESCPINGYMPIVESNLLSSICKDSLFWFTFAHNYL